MPEPVAEPLQIGMESGLAGTVDRLTLAAPVTRDRSDSHDGPRLLLLAARRGFVQPRYRPQNVHVEDQFVLLDIVLIHRHLRHDAGTVNRHVKAAHLVHDLLKERRCLLESGHVVRIGKRAPLAAVERRGDPLQLLRATRNQRHIPALAEQFLRERLPDS